MTRFRLTVEYDGRPFMGWQRQAHGPSIQQAIEEAVEAITGERATLHAAGRTDAGVHALAMSAHVDIAKPITPFRLADGINAKLRPLPVARIGGRRLRWTPGAPGGCRWCCTPTRCTMRRRSSSAGTISRPSGRRIARRRARSRRWTC